MQVATDRMSREMTDGEVNGGEWEIDGEQGDGSVGDGAGPMNSSPPCLMCPDNLLTTADYC